LAYVEPPLRAELFCADQMEQHGKTLAESRMLSPGHAPDRLLARLAKNEGILMYRARGSIASLFFRLEAIPAEDIESGTPSC
jgi:cyclic beta-1,2-glucan synthetase